MKPGSRSFSECDDVAGWSNTERDERLWKYVRPHDENVAKTPIGDMFQFVRDVKLPPSFLINDDSPQKDTTTTATLGTATDPTRRTSTDPTQHKGTPVDRGDIYEAFSRTSNASIRGVFANGEPVWGMAEYRNGMSFTGMFKGGMPHGFGEKRAGASVFKGQFQAGKRHGRGLFLDASHFRLYAGRFIDDQPHGGHLCILYKWCETNKRVTHTRKSLQFNKGTLVKFEPNDSANVNILSGLCYEEFLKIYREGEKAVEDVMARQRLADMGAEDFLWQPVPCESYYSTTVNTVGVEKETI
jgi:hypothetical protein